MAYYNSYQARKTKKRGMSKAERDYNPDLPDGNPGVDPVQRLKEGVEKSKAALARMKERKEQLKIRIVTTTPPEEPEFSHDEMELMYARDAKRRELIKRIVKLSSLQESSVKNEEEIKSLIQLLREARAVGRPDEEVLPVQELVNELKGVSQYLSDRIRSKFGGIVFHLLQEYVDLGGNPYEIPEVREFIENIAGTDAKSAIENLRGKTEVAIIADKIAEAENMYKQCKFGEVEKVCAEASELIKQINTCKSGILGLRTWLNGYPEAAEIQSKALIAENYFASGDYELADELVSKAKILQKTYEEKKQAEAKKRQEENRLRRVHDNRARHHGGNGKRK